MNPLYRLSLCFMLLHGAVSLSQQTAVGVHEAVFPAQGYSFEIDRLGNIYWISGSRLLRVNPETGHRQSYSNPSYGNILFVDVSDPLNIMVHHGALNQVLWLDRNLSPKVSPRNLPAHEIGDFRVVSGSAMGGFWAFHPKVSRIIHYSQSFAKKAQTLPLYEVIPGFNAPEFIVESEGMLFVNQPDIGIAVFDLFGNFLFFIEKTGLSRFQVLGNNIFFFTESELISFNFIQKTQSVILQLEKPILDGKIAGNTVFVLTRSGLYSYKLDGQ